MLMNCINVISSWNTTSNIYNIINYI